MITLDLHMHTDFSDGKLPMGKLVNLCGEAGLSAIAITDHLCTEKHILGRSAKVLNITVTEKSWPAYMQEIQKQKNRAWKEYGMLVYAGIEYTHNTFSHSRNAHMLAIDVKEFIDPALNEEMWLTAAKAQSALTVAAHPLKIPDASSQTYYLLANAKKFAGLIDVWETANARTFWREMLDTPYSLIASSDLHSGARWPAWRTSIECANDPEAIKEFFKNPMNPRDFIFMFGRTTEIKNRIRRELKCS